ncbi:MAG: sugar transferase [Alphaproteobacteria bacterium]
MTEQYLAHYAESLDQTADFEHAKLAANDIPGGVTGIIKRALDLAIALPALVLLSPFLLAFIILIRTQDGGAAIFSQKRVGLGGREFWCLKLRTMLIDAQDRLESVLASDPQAAEEWRAHGKLFKDPRITPLGHFLRRSSLDELPQLINVIRGDMSIVGPRPIQRYECERYEDLLRYYISARPGITGLWQISGRSNTSYRQRCELDMQYVKGWSLWADIVILVRTIPAVLRSEGAV